MNDLEIIRELKTCVQLAANEGIIGDETHSTLIEWLKDREEGNSDDDMRCSYDLYDERPEANCEEGCYE